MRPHIRQTRGGNTPEEWWSRLPPITKCYLVAALMCTVLSQFGLVSPGALVWSWPAVRRFQIWRLITTFTFFGGFGFNFVMQLVMLVQYSSRYEANPFNTGGGGGSADYAMMLIFGMTTLLLINTWLGAFVLGQSLMYMIMYVWSCREPDAIVSVFGFTLQAMYLPWAMAALQLLMSGPEALVYPGLGIAVGHLYWFLIDTVPIEYGYNLIKTPALLVRSLPGSSSSGVEVRPPPSAATAAGRATGPTYNWEGSGRALGSQ